MRIPKTIKLGGIDYDIILDKSYNRGGKGSTVEQKITIGAKNNNKQRIFENLIHEICELTCLERGFRYSCNDDNSGIVFVMDHNQFDIFAADLAGTLYTIFED